MAIRGILSRRGSGAVKHTAVVQLWCQELSESRRCRFRLVPRGGNVAAVFARTASLKKAVALLEDVGVMVCDHSADTMDVHNCCELLACCA